MSVPNEISLPHYEYTSVSPGGIPPPASASNALNIRAVDGPFASTGQQPQDAAADWDTLAEIPIIVPVDQVLGEWQEPGLFGASNPSVVPPVPPATPDPFGLKTAENFAILAASTVTNVVSAGTVITGNLGLSPGTSVTGFPPGIVNGTQHITDSAAAQAQIDAMAAFVAAALLPTTQDLTGQDLGGLVLGPGVYNFSSSAQLTGTLTLDGQGNSNATFVFKIGSTLTTASNAIVTLINNASNDRILWKVGSSATLGIGTTFLGSILAQASVTFVTGTSMTGRAIGLTGAVTLDTNVVTASVSAPAPPLPVEAVKESTVQVFTGAASTGLQPPVSIPFTGAGWVTKFVV